jgi:hypothetical protein
VRVAAPLHPRNRLGYLVFSHGANSNNALYDLLLAPIAEAGFLVAAPTHVDAEINPDRAQFDRAQVYATRLADLAAVGAATAEVAKAAGLEAADLDLEARGVAGHSYGALLALQCVGAGARPPGGAVTSVRDATLRAALALSPPGPLPGFLDPEQFATLAAPVLLTTGHKDIAPGFVDAWESRLIALDRTPTKPAYAAIFKDVDHYYGGLICRREVPGPEQPESLARTVTLAQLFLRAHVLRDREAAAALARTQSGAGLEWRVRA